MYGLIRLVCWLTWQFALAIAILTSFSFLLYGIYAIGSYFMSWSIGLTKKLLKGKLAIVNLIPYNEVAERPYKRSTNEAVQKFYKILSEEGITVSIRREMGRDIAAACGQLRLGHS